MLDKVMMERKEVRKDYDERLAHLEIRMENCSGSAGVWGFRLLLCLRGFLRPEKEQ